MALSLHVEEFSLERDLFRDIVHGFNTRDVLVQAWRNNAVISADYLVIDENTIRVGFGTPLKNGKVIVVGEKVAKTKPKAVRKVPKKVEKANEQSNS